MNRNLLTAAVAVAMSLAVPPSAARAAEANVDQLTAQVEKLLAAYNQDDVKAFYADWAKSVEAIANEMTYNLLFKMGSKSDVGAYTPKTAKFRKDGSVLEGDFLVVYFDAEFANTKQGQIAVNFQKEGDAFKFLQVQLSKKP